MEKDIQRALITKFRKNIYAKVMNACETYNLIKPNDKIAVCISGGKDSMLLAKCMQELQAHGSIPFEIIYISMDPGYNKENKEKIIENSKILNINIEFFDAPIFQYTKTLKENPCYLCARMRRGYLYNYAKKRGCNKIALGHHADDVIETTLLALLYSNEITFMRPKLTSKNYERMELIRPLYEVKEEAIIQWMKYHNLDFIQCACPLQEDFNKDSNSKRNEIKQIIKDLKKYNKEVDDCLFRSIHNVNLGTLVGARLNEEKFDFNCIYEKEVGDKNE